MEVTKLSKSKTSSLRLSTKTYDEIDNICDEVGCTRNDWLKDAAKEKLRAENAQDQEVIEDTKSEPKPTIEIIETKEEPKPRVELIPKEIIKEVPQDNSNKPVVQFTQFNGKLLPVAKRFNA